MGECAGFLSLERGCGFGSIAHVWEVEEVGFDRLAGEAEGVCSR